MLLLGHLGCARSRKLAFLLVAGGMCVGLSQLCPSLYIIVGAISQEITVRVLHLPVDPHGLAHFSTLSGGFLMTLLSGGQLLAAALLCGQLIWLMKSSWRLRGRSSVD